MERFRTIFGAVSIAGFLLGLNMLAFSPSFMSIRVAGPLIVALAAGAAWLVLASGGIVATARNARALGGLNAFVASVLFLGICIVVYAFAAHWDRTFDFTQQGLRELAPQTVQLLQSLDEDVEIACFFAVGGDSAISAARDRTRRFLDRCQRYTGHLKYAIYDQEKEGYRLQALGVDYRIGPQGTIVLVCAGRKRVIQLAGTNPRLEERDFTNALINVVRNAVPKIGYLTGHKERDLNEQDERLGASRLKALLERESYVIEPVSILLTDPSIPQDCSVLLINRLGSDLNAVEIQAIQDYLDRGGRLLLLLDPALARGGTGEVLRPWLDQQFGIVVGSDILVSKYGRVPDQVLLLRETYALEWPEFSNPDNGFTACYNDAHAITHGFNMQMILPGCRTVRMKPEDQRPKGVKGAELLFSLPDTWAETDLELLQHGRGKASPGSNEPIRSHPLAVSVHMDTDIPLGDSDQKKQARIVVIGDSDFVSNNSIDVVGNVNFLLNTLAWLTENEDLIAIRPTGAEDKPVLLDDRARGFIAWFSTLGMLTGICVAAAAAYALRRRYQ